VFVCWLHLLNQLTNTQDIGTSYIWISSQSHKCQLPIK
jgi:hypothetical protein